MKKMWTYKQYATIGISIDEYIIAGGYYGCSSDQILCCCCKTPCKYYEKCQSCHKQYCAECLFYKDKVHLNKRDLTCYFCIDENCTGEAYVKEKTRKIDSYRVDGDKYKVAEKELN